MIQNIKDYIHEQRLRLYQAYIARVLTRWSNWQTELSRLQDDVDNCLQHKNAFDAVEGAETILYMTHDMITYCRRHENLLTTDYVTTQCHYLMTIHDRARAIINYHKKRVHVFE